MKSVFLFLLTTLSVYGLYAQEFRKVNRDTVRQLVSNEALPTFYPRLLDRFYETDTTLTQEDFRLLYYGFVFQDAYSGYPDLKQRETNTAIKNQEYMLAELYCDSVLAKMPVNLFANYSKAMAIYLRDSTDPRFIPYQWRYANLIDAIVSSGDGLSAETAFKTICVNDEYQIMYQYFRIPEFKGQSLVGQCDVMAVTPSDYFTADKMYFDTSETMMAFQRMFDKETSSDNDTKKKKKSRKKNGK